MIRRGPGLAGLLALTLWSASAAGQPPADARASFEQGVRLLEDARYAEAAAALERSLALRESPSVLYNLALAYRGTGAYLRAIETFERFLRAAPEREPLRRDAATIAAELRGALARVRLSVRGLADEVRLDDRVLTARELDVVLPVDPGRHVFEARRAGYESATRTLTLAPGATDDVLLDVTAHPLPARLQVQVSVDDAVISVDGVERGRGTFSGELPPGAHTLEVISDDGVRVWIDDRLVIDRWSIHESTVDHVPIAAGRHRIRLEYFEMTGWAELQVRFRRQ